MRDRHERAELTALALDFGTGSPQELRFSSATLTVTTRMIPTGGFGGASYGEGRESWGVDVMLPRPVDSGFNLAAALFEADTVLAEMVTEDGRHLRGRAMPHRTAGSPYLHLEGAGNLDEQ